MSEYNIKESAGWLGLSVKRLYDLIENGEIPCPRSDSDDKYRRYYTKRDLVSIQKMLAPRRRRLAPVIATCAALLATAGLALGFAFRSGGALPSAQADQTEQAVDGATSDAPANDIIRELEVQREAHTAPPGMFERCANLEPQATQPVTSPRMAKARGRGPAGLE